MLKRKRAGHRPFFRMLGVVRPVRRYARIRIWAVRINWGKALMLDIGE